MKEKKHAGLRQEREKRIERKEGMCERLTK
jgi:hypothetical protein